MTSIFRRVRPLDAVLAGVLTSIGAALMIADVRATDVTTRVDSHSWWLVPVFAAATAPILFRRLSTWAVLGVTAAALAVHDVAFGWDVRCGAGLPLAFALAYSVGRLVADRRQSAAGLVAVVGIQFLVLVRDSAAGLPIIPVTAAVSAACWGAGLYVQKRAQRSPAPAAAPVETFA